MVPFRLPCPGLQGTKAASSVCVTRKLASASGDDSGSLEVLTWANPHGEASPEALAARSTSCMPAWAAHSGICVVFGLCRSFFLLLVSSRIEFKCLASDYSTY